MTCRTCLLSPAAISRSTKPPFRRWKRDTPWSCSLTSSQKHSGFSIRSWPGPIRTRCWPQPSRRVTNRLLLLGTHASDDSFTRESPFTFKSLTRLIKDRLRSRNHSNWTFQENPLKMRYLGTLLLFPALLCATAFSQTAKPAADLPKLEHLSAHHVNPHIDPCTDFYQYTCSKYFAANPIPADRSNWGVLGPLSDWNAAQIRIALEAAAAKKQGRTPVEQKIGDFWNSCINEDKVDASSAKILKAELQQIDALRSKPQLADEIARLHMAIPAAWIGGDASTSAPLFGFGSSQDLDDASRVVDAFDQRRFALPGREFYLDKDEKSTAIRAQYLAHIANILKLAGEPEKQAASDAAVVLELETALAASAMDIVKRRDPKNLNNKRTLPEIEKASPSFDWKRYLADLHAPATDRYLVSAPDFFSDLSKLIDKHPLEHWKIYLRWQLLHTSATFLARPFSEENFEFFGKEIGRAHV